MTRLDWLKNLTGARVSLGPQLATTDWLALRAAHAAARDAIHAEVVWPPVTAVVRSRCRNREDFLLRPDAGRRLDPTASLPKPDQPLDVVWIVVDGLSPLAVTRYAATVLDALAKETAGLTAGGPVAVEQGRVAIGDEIGERMGARLSVVLIGERPGLSSADSLGLYLTYQPRVGRTDAERNCLSNIREGGLSPLLAAERCAALIRAALSRGLTGVALKEEFILPASPSTVRSIPSP